MPGATCNCGHLSCFHVAAAESPSPGQSRAEVELVKQRLQLLEESVEKEQYERHCSIVTRVSQMEETVDRNREEMTAELKGSYRNMHAAWQLIEQLQKRMNHLDGLWRAQNERMGRVDKGMRELRDRQLELVDSNDTLEDRIEDLEEIGILPAPFVASMEKKGLVPNPNPALVKDDKLRLPLPLTNSHTLARVESSTNPQQSTSWTVHVSLLPSKEQPFPFEKDTTSYKRCLSRGLQRMIAVEGHDSQSFVKAVSRSFETLLKGRPWMPLQAKLCDAQKLQGLPMLRPLDPKLEHGTYDAEFLRKYCALCDGKGKMDSLYIAMQHETLSWSFLRHAPVYLEGLESSWDYDEYLDKKVQEDLDVTLDTGVAKKEDKQNLPSEKLVSSLRPLKRPASEVPRPLGLDEGEPPRKRMLRSCKTAMIEVRREVRTV